VRETNPAGSIYSFRFLRPGNLLLRQIEKDMAVSGLPSPWMRGLPRLHTNAKHLPVPLLATVRFGAGDFNMGVRNFTLGGLLLEYNGSDLNHLAIGARLELDLMTNGGDQLAGMAGTVTHISAELNELRPDSSSFQFGVKFSGMNSLTELRYRTLIRDHCLGLKGEFTVNAG
jgi:hypothetical protein